MFEQVLPDHTKERLALLAEREILPEQTYLAGGTAIALWLGHRISYDLDFFALQEFDVEKLTKNLKAIKDFKLSKSDWQTVMGSFPEVKFSCFYYQYPLVDQPTDFEGIKIAGPKDLLASKIAAVSSRGTKRDFVDIYYILKNDPSVSLSEALKLYDQRFQKLASNKLHIVKSLDYFADADADNDPKMLTDDYSWEKIKEFFRQETKKIAM